MKHRTGRVTGRCLQWKWWVGLKVEGERERERGGERKASSDRRHYFLCDRHSTPPDFVSLERLLLCCRRVPSCSTDTTLSRIRRRTIPHNLATALQHDVAGRPEKRSKGRPASLDDQKARLKMMTMYLVSLSVSGVQKSTRTIAGRTTGRKSLLVETLWRTTRAVDRITRHFIRKSLSKKRNVRKKRAQHNEQDPRKDTDDSNGIGARGSVFSFYRTPSQKKKDRHNARGRAALQILFLFDSIDDFLTVTLAMPPRRRNKWKPTQRAGAPNEARGPTWPSQNDCRIHATINFCYRFLLCHSAVRSNNTNIARILSASPSATPGTIIPPRPPKKIT